MVTAPARLTLPAASSGVRAARIAVVIAACAVVPLVLPCVWIGFRFSLLPNTVLGTLEPLEAPWSVRDPLGVWALLLVLGWFGLAYRAQTSRWWELPLVLLGAALVLPRVGNAWLAAPLLWVPLWARLRGVHWRGAAAATVAVLSLLVAVALAWQSRPPALPQEVETVALASQGTVFADWRWAPALQRAGQGGAVLGSKGLAGESIEYWLDYLRVVQGHDRWSALLDGWGAQVLALRPEDEALLRLVRSSPRWRVLRDDSEAFVAARTGL